MSNFPVMNDGFPLAPSSVPWDFVAPFEAGAQRNHSQSLARLAQRGGLSVSELLAVIENRGWERIEPKSAVERLNRYLAEFEAKRDKYKSRLEKLANLVWETRWVSEDEDYQKLVGIAAEIRSGNFKGVDSL
jgi:hypothetical protein